MRMSKTDKIANWLHDGKNVSYGSLHLMGDVVLTYDVILARINRVAKTATVNMENYSVTSSGHRNRLIEALELSGYAVSRGRAGCRRAAEGEV